MVSGLTFNSLTHSELNFVYDSGPVLFFCRRHPIFPIPFSEKTALSPLCIFGSCVNSVIICVWVYLWVCCFVPLIYVSVFMSALYCLNYHSLVIQFGIRECVPALLFLKVALAIQGLLWFQTDFRIICSVSVKNKNQKNFGIFIGIVSISSLHIAQHSMNILIILILPVHEHGLSSYISVLLQFLFTLLFVLFFSAAPATYGSAQARG